MATRYRVREHDQWGGVRYLVDGERIWLGDQARGVADLIIEPDPYHEDCFYIKRENTHGEKLFYLQPNPHGEGLLVREKDAWGTVRFFVEGSRWSSEALLVREGDQHGSVAWYVEPYDLAGGGGDVSYPHEPTALDRIYSRFNSGAINMLSGIKARYGAAGVALVAITYIITLTLVVLIIDRLMGGGFLLMMLYGLLVMGGILFIAGRAV